MNILIKNEKKHIKVEYVETELGVLARIVEQTHIRSHFGEKNDRFQCKNGTNLVSVSYPEIMNDKFCMRGNKISKNDTVLYFTKERFKIFSEAVKEYNRFFSGKKEKVKVPLSTNIKILE